MLVGIQVYMPASTAGYQHLAADARRCCRIVVRGTNQQQGDGHKVKVIGQPFDLHCQKKSGVPKDLWVEVKGSQGDAGEVILTRGEVEFYSKRFPDTELFVVNSIHVANGTARGGKPVRYRRWRARPDALRPIAYWYRLPSRNP